MENENCLICGSEVKEYFVKKIKYSECSSCGFIFNDRRTLLSPPEEKSRYLAHNNSLENEGYVKLLNKFIDKCVCPFIPPDGKILDYGSGPEPVLSSLLEKRGFTTEIYDVYFSTERVFEGKTYDAVTSVEVIEHLRNPMAALRLIEGMIKPGGIFAIRTMFLPSDNNPWVETTEFKAWWYRGDKTHISFYSPKTLECIAEELNMKVEFIEKPCFCVLKKD